MAHYSFSISTVQKIVRLVTIVIIVVVNFDSLGATVSIFRAFSAPGVENINKRYRKKIILFQKI